MLIKTISHYIFLQRLGTPMWCRFRDRSQHTDGWDPASPHPEVTRTEAKKKFKNFEYSSSPNPNANHP